MSLVSNIEKLLSYAKGVSQETIDQAIKEIIESHRQTLRKHSTYQGLTKEYRESARKALILMDKVLAGKTTFQNEVYKLNQDIRVPNELFILFHENFNVILSTLLPQARTLDKTIKRLYWQKK